MIDVEDLIALVRNYNPRTNEDLIRRAYAYGLKMHEGQSRQSGEPYFTHPVAVAAILTEQRLDDATIVTALLHDTIEDTKSTYSEVSRLFGVEVAELVDGVTKLTNLQLSSTQSKQAENFRKLFMAMSKDLRVILVKLADRMHNMRTIKSMKPEKQAQKARETMEIFAPLAGRMGMQWMREELEDLAFRVLNPDARNSIIRRFITLQRETGDVVHRITADIRAELEKAQIEADVYGRAKKPYSIWRKMQEKDLAFSRLSDIYGFRVICTSEQDCYRILGVIHQRWRAVPGRFKDYISQPKSNGYRSIHTTVSGRDGKRVEVQIRTRQMHEVAEAGVAAHWSYRDGVRARNPFAVDPSKWIASMTERLDQEDHNEFLENVKLEMYSDQVFCFTPKGDVIQLPRGATPLDYAYAIHTRIGNSCVSAKVDGIRVPLWTRLKNGQSVEIITAEGQMPQSSWIDIVTTGRAKAAIRKSLREEDRGRNLPAPPSTMSARRPPTRPCARRPRPWAWPTSRICWRASAPPNSRRAASWKRSIPNWCRPRRTRWMPSAPSSAWPPTKAFAGPAAASRCRGNASSASPIVAPALSSMPSTAPRWRNSRNSPPAGLTCTGTPAAMPPSTRSAWNSPFPTMPACWAGSAP